MEELDAMDLPIGRTLKREEINLVLSLILFAFINFTALQHLINYYHKMLTIVFNKVDKRI